MYLPQLSQPDELYGKTKVALLRRIADCVEAHVEKLPPESELAKQLGVSRVLIRDIFGELESRGYISRKQGDLLYRVDPRAGDDSLCPIDAGTLGNPGGKRFAN